LVLGQVGEDNIGGEVNNIGEERISGSGMGGRTEGDNGEMTAEQRISGGVVGGDGWVAAVTPR
jgi:hypothetical protein